MSGEIRVVGQIRPKMCVAPDSEAAYEYLLWNASRTNMPMDAVKGEFSPSWRPDGIGTLGFGEPSSTPGRIMFVRDSIAVMIDGRGDLGSETLLLTRKIDSLILKQPAESREDLVGRTPSTTISTNLKISPTGQRFLTVEVSAPAGHRIITVAANAGDEVLPINDGEIFLGRRAGKIKIRVVAITDELLVGRCEVELDLPGD